MLNLFNLGQWARNGGMTCVILTAAVFVASSAVAQERREINEGTVINGVTVQWGQDDVIVNGGNFQNGMIGGSITREVTNVTLNAGAGTGSSNQQGSTVTGSVDVKGGAFHNVAGGTVGAFNLSPGGGFTNDGTVTGTGTVSGGVLNNTGAVSALTQNDGTVHNSGKITGVTTLSGTGTFNNRSGGTLAELIYNGGTYNDQGGTIDSLTLGGNTGAANFGTVNSLSFSDTGSGILGITGTWSGDGFDFAGINVSGTANLMKGGIALNLVGYENDFFAADNGLLFSLNDLFGSSADIVGMDSLAFFAISFDGRDYMVNGDDFGWGWRMDEFGNVSYSNEVPEPATLVMLGLGLTGLGLARRRRK